MVGIWSKRDEGCMPPLEDEIPPPLVCSKPQVGGEKKKTNIQKNIVMRSKYEPRFPELSNDRFSSDEQGTGANKVDGGMQESTYFVHSFDFSNGNVSTGLVEPPILMGLVANSTESAIESGSLSIPISRLSYEVGNADGHSFFMSQASYFDPVIPPSHFGYSVAGFASGLHGNVGMSGDQCEHRVQRMMRIIRRRNDDEDGEDDTRDSMV